MNSKKRWLMAGAATLAALTATVAAAQEPVRPTNRPPPPPPAEEEGAEVEAVVVTGSFLRSTPETATIPVESYNLETLRNQGNPSSLDFVKNLSEIGQVFGESNRAATLGNGQQTINLRSLGASRTVVLFNGRRLNEEYSFGLGRSNNIATIPQCAIGKVDILKDGGGTTYGADAVGGVVNYITRRNVSGTEVQASYRHIDGSSGGDYNACVTIGKVVGKGNIQGSFGYIHRSILPVVERDFAFVDYLTNQNSYLGVNNPGTYLLTQTTAAGNFAMTPTGVTLSNAQNAALGGAASLTVQNLQRNLTYQFTNDLQFGSNGGFRDPNCSTLGGFASWAGSGTGATPACYTANGYFQNLVEESDIFQSYIEGNWEFSPKFKVHGEYSFYWLDLPNIPLDVFTAQPQAWPFARDKSGNVTGFAQLVGATPVFLAPSYNPAVQDFVATLRNSNGTSIFTPAQLAGWQSSSYQSPLAIALPVTTWKPFGLGGGAFDGDNDDQDNRSVQHRGTIEFSGDLGKFFIGTWDWDFAVTHGWGNYFLTAPDILVDRLQAALNGYGGPNCPGTPGSAANPAPGGVPQIAPGTNGCKFFNPFPSAYPRNVVTGQASPTFNAARVNDRDLVEWMYTEVETNYPGTFDVIDFVLRGDLDYHLWADEPIRMAIGGQYRERHGITDTRDIGDARLNPCATPGVLTCTGFANGPLLYRRHFNISGTSQDYDRRYPTTSAFAEMIVPVTDKLTTQVSTRWEKYYSDLGGVDRAVMVSGGGLRWQMFPKFALRATAQQNFSQANPLAPVPDVPTTVQNVPGAFGGVTGANYLTLNVANQGVRPERGFNYNIGGVFEVSSQVTLTADYYNIHIGQVIDPGGLSATTVITAAAVPGTTGITTLLNCEHPIVAQPQPTLGGRAFFQLPAGYTCVQGVTTVSDALQGIQTQDPNRVKLGTTQVSFFGGQGQERRTYNGGSLDTSGVDLKARWSRPDTWGGDLSVTADLTYILTYEVGSFQILGIPYSQPYDGIGYVNNGSARPGGQRIYPWRGSIGFNFRKGKHNFNWLTRGVASISSNDTGTIDSAIIPGANRNANIGDINGNYVSATCNQQFLIAPPVPTGAGTGLYGARNTVGGNIVYGYNPCTNTSITTSYGKLYSQFNSSFTYRVQLPHEVDFSVTVDNVFGVDPSFSRDGLNYDSSSSAGPLGRTYQVSIRKTFN
jgi:iron complex outermembrane recepter protein